MSVYLKCAACGHEVPFKDGEMSTEAICPGCEVLLRRRAAEDLMAIPVSMALPDSFVPADLGRVPKHSRELIHRYKTSANGPVGGPPAGSGGEANVVLARAIERLAHALEGPGQQSSGPSSASPASPSPDLTALLSAAGQAGVSEDQMNQILSQLAQNGSLPASQEPAEVLVLSGHQSGNGKSTSVGVDGRALPVEAPVLVRREAAAEAHRYRRENQAATDIKGQKQSAVAEWVEKHPMVMMVTGLIFLIALVVMTTLVMDGKFAPSAITESGEPTMVDDTNADGPDFHDAEREARGFLNAVGLNAARPYIYQASRISQKLEEYYEPISDPGNYQLEFRSRQRKGDRSVYYYQVESGDKVQPVVVLQERDNFKVFWEFGACVGDLSWAAFLESEPERPVVMKAFLRPERVHDPLHPAETWSSWRAQDWDGTHSIRVYCKKGSTEERRLISAYQEFPVVRNSSNWVMAQVSLQHLRSISGKGEDLLESSEVVQVPLGSWLPKEYVDGNTFYPDRARVKGSVQEIQGFKD